MGIKCCQAEFFTALPSGLHFTSGLHLQSQTAAYLCCCILGITAGKSGQLCEICDRVADGSNQSGFSMGRGNQVCMPGISDSLGAAMVGGKVWEEKDKLNRRK